MSRDRTHRDNIQASLAGDVPRMQSMWDIDEYHAPGQGSQTARRGSRSERLNLRAVSDVLENYGLDPIEELAKVLVKEEPARSRDGTPIVDPDGKPLMKPTLDIETRVKLLTELAQYTRPKLKSVEVVNKGPELTDDQIDRRLQALLERTKKAG